MEIPAAKVYGVVTFYSFFTMIPKGKHPISICTGTACYVRGAEKVLNEFKKQLEIEVGETDVNGLFSLSCLRCVGACGLAPVVQVGDKTYGRVATDDARRIGLPILPHVALRRCRLDEIFERPWSRLVDGLIRVTECREKSFPYVSSVSPHTIQ